MQFIIPLFPSLAAGFLLPFFSADVQLIGLGLLLIFYIRLVWQQKRRGKIPIPFLSAAAVLFSAIFLMILWILFPNPWLYYSVFPSIIGGFLIGLSFLFVPQNPLSVFAVFTIASWTMLVLSGQYIQFLPDVLFYTHWQHALLSTDSAAVEPALQVPSPHTLLQLQWAAYVSCFHFLIAIRRRMYASPQKTAAYIFDGILFLYLLFFVYMCGKPAGFSIIIFLLCMLAFYWIPKRQFSFLHDWLFVVSLLLAVSAGLGWLDSMILQVSALLMTVDISFLAPAAVSFSALAQVPSVHHPWEAVDWLALASLMFIVIAGISRKERSSLFCLTTALYSSLALSALLIAPFSGLHWLANPIVWLCFGGIAFSHSEQKLTQETPADDHTHPFVYFFWDYRFTIVLGSLSLWGMFILHAEWKAEGDFIRLLRSTPENNRLAAAEQAHRDSFYRPDFRALYLTLFMQDAVQTSSPLSDGKLLELEVASQSCSRYGFIPYLAIQRISDYYFVNGNPSRAVNSIEEQLAIHPNDTTLHKLLAGRLFEFGRYEQALEHYRVCVTASPTDVNLYKKIALSYKSLGNDEAYNKTVDIIHTLNPLAETE